MTERHKVGHEARDILYIYVVVMGSRWVRCPWKSCGWGIPKGLDVLGVPDGRGVTRFGVCLGGSGGWNVPAEFFFFIKLYFNMIFHRL